MGKQSKRVLRKRAYGVASAGAGGVGGSGPGGYGYGGYGDEDMMDMGSGMVGDHAGRGAGGVGHEDDVITAWSIGVVLITLFTFVGVVYYFAFSNDDSLFESGTRALNDNKLDIAISHLEAARNARVSDREHVLNNLAIAYHRSGDKAAAAAAWREAVDTHGGAGGGNQMGWFGLIARFNYANSLRAEGLLDEPLQHYASIAALNSSCADASSPMASSTLCHHVVHNAPDFITLLADTHLFAGVLLREKGLVAQAEPELKRAAQLDPAITEPLIQLAQLHAGLGRAKSATYYLRKCLRVTTAATSTSAAAAAAAAATSTAPAAPAATTTATAADAPPRASSRRAHPASDTSGHAGHEDDRVCDRDGGCEQATTRDATSATTGSSSPEPPLHEDDDSVPDNHHHSSSSSSSNNIPAGGGRGSDSSSAPSHSTGSARARGSSVSAHEDLNSSPSSSPSVKEATSLLSPTLLDSLAASQAQALCYAMLANISEASGDTRRAVSLYRSSLEAKGNYIVAQGRLHALEGEPLVDEVQVVGDQLNFDLALYNVFPEVGQVMWTAFTSVVDSVGVGAGGGGAVRGGGGGSKGSSQQAKKGARNDVGEGATRQSKSAEAASTSAATTATAPSAVNITPWFDIMEVGAEQAVGARHFLPAANLLCGTYTSHGHFNVAKVAGAYTRLELADPLAAVQSSSSQSWDVLLAPTALTQLWRVDGWLVQAFAALRPHGLLLASVLEPPPSHAAAATHVGVRVVPERLVYAHARHYVERMAQAAGFVVVARHEMTGSIDQVGQVKGHVYVFERPPSHS